MKSRSVTLGTKKNFPWYCLICCTRRFQLLFWVCWWNPMIWLITMWIACDYFSWNCFNVCMTSTLPLLTASASPKPNRKTESLPSVADSLIFAKENKENIIISNYWIRLSMTYSDRLSFFPKTPDRRLHLQMSINFAKILPRFKINQG